MIKFFRFYLFALILLFTSIPVLSQTYFSTRLTRQQVPGRADTTTIGMNNLGPIGTGVFILGNNSATGQTTDRNTLRFIITVGNLGKNDTSSTGGRSDTSATSMLKSIQFRIGAIGDTGRIVRTITQGIRGNSFSGTWGEGDPEPLSSEIRDDMSKGMLYVVAQTDSGEIRGQIHAASGAGFVSHLTGPQEVDSVSTKASGVATLLLTDLGLIYHISVQGLTQTRATINRGDPGMKGPVVKQLNFNGNSAFGIWSLQTGSDTIGLALEKVLLAEGLYINVESQRYSTGEIRGQILHAGGFSFSSPLMATRTDTAGQTRRDTSKGSQKLVGNASYTLTDHGLVYHINLNTRGQMATLYFSNELTNQRIKDIPGFADSSISSTWLTNEENTPLTDQRVTDLLQGRMSLVAVVGTDTLKGRIIPHKQTNFTALITGLQETPRNMSKGSGVGHFILTDQGLSYHITIEGIDTISAAHFHMAPMGVSGGVVFPITFDSTHTASGTWSRSSGSNNLTDNMIDALLRGEIYVNVHTPSHPAGEIRGQLVAASGTDFKAELVSRSTNSGQMQQAQHTGTANFMLSNEGLVYKLTMDSVKISGLDFVHGAIGESGRIINSVTINADTGNTIVGVWRRTGGTQPLADTLVNALLTGDVYVVLHTSDNSMTIRGQVLPNGGWGFVSVFNPMGSAGRATAFQNANGNAIYTLTDAGLKYDIAVEGFRDNAAGIYAGQAGGQSGNLVHQLTGSFNGGTTKGSWLMVNDSTSAINNIPLLLSSGLFLKLQGTDTTGRFSAQITRNFETPIVSVSKENLSPRTFHLEQNYPNPFNPTTTIKFSIPEQGMVNLSVYNIIGEKVATIIDGQTYRAGNYQVNFDGSRLASGVYFYRLNLGNNFTTKKMLLVK